MKTFVGLGNPGERYRFNRHNIGFQIVDAVFQEYAQSQWVKKFGGSYCKCSHKKMPFLILKPETFMNNSGESVGAVTSFFKLKPSDIIVIHDDLDLEIGQIKVKIVGGHAGHNGLKSIHKTIGNQYTRIRIGIGRPDKKSEVSSYVLSNFTSSQNIQMEYYKTCFISGIEALIKEDFSTFLDLTRNKSSEQTGSHDNKNINRKISDVSQSSDSDTLLDNKNFKFLIGLFKR